MRDKLYTDRQYRQACHSIHSSTSSAGRQYRQACHSIHSSTSWAGKQYRQACHSIHSSTSWAGKLWALQSYTDRQYRQACHSIHSSTSCGRCSPPSKSSNANFFKQSVFGGGQQPAAKNEEMTVFVFICENGIHSVQRERSPRNPGFRWGESGKTSFSIIN